MTIAITSSGITLDGPLVAGEKVAVSVSGLSFTAEDKPTLALLARFPDVLLASVELAESETAGTWTGELDTATKQTALFFATARADERRDAALELVAGRASLARLTVPMANSALCPKPDGSPFASPVYVPVPGPPGQGGDPYDQAPEMDGEASAGTADEYARGDHRHPTDTTRQAVVEDLAAIRSGAAAGATAVQPSALSAYRTAAAQDAIDGAQDAAIAAKYTKPATGIPASDLAPGVIPTAPVTSVNGETGDVAIYGNTLIMAQGQSTLVSAAIANAQGDATRALNELPFKAYSGSLAPAFSTSSTYAVGDYVTHEGLLYKCTTAVTTAGAWNAANWTAVAVTDEMGADTPLPFDAECEYVTFPSGAYIPTGIIGKGPVLQVDLEIRAPSTFDTTGDFRFGTWSGNATSSMMIWMATSPRRFDFIIGSDSYISDFSAIVGQFGHFGYDGKNVYCGSEKVASGATGVFSSASDFTLGGLNGAASSGVSFDMASAKFAISGAIVRDFIPVRVGSGANAVGYLYDKVSGRLFGSAVGSIPLVPGPDKATPTITTPGRIVELTPAIRYAFASPTPTVSGTSATVACEDRAINDFTVATGITSLTITPPAAVTGGARDFFCRVILTDSSLPTVTLSGATIDIGASEVAGMTQGVNLLMFTEIASGHWLASRRSAS